MGDLDFVVKDSPAGDDTVGTDAIIDGQVGKDDINTTTSGQALVTKIIAGTNVTITETGVDSGTGDVTINASGGGGSVTFHQDRTRDSSITGTVNGVNTAFSLSSTPASSSSVLLHLNGIALEDTTHYSLSGASITMVDAPDTGDNLLAYYVT